MDKDFELAKVILDHSLKIKPKEKILIIVSELGMSLGKAVFLETLKRGAYPLFDVEVMDIAKGFFTTANEWQLRYFPKNIAEAKNKWADAYMRIAAEESGSELAGIEASKISERSKLTRPYWDRIVDSERWVLTFYPTKGMAKQAKMSLSALRKYYFDSCLVDYHKMKLELEGLEKLLNEGKEIHVAGKMTDLRVKIGGRLSQACCGEFNIPDGECFLAPVTDGVNGKVYFDLPTLAYGKEVRGIQLEFKDGKVIKASAEQGESELLQMLATDPGAKYLGEFAIGTNFQIKQAMRSTIFDEKIGGTIHMALGKAFREKKGGGENKSMIHWDIVKDMRLPGSVLTIDGRVVLKDGKLLV